MAPPLLRAADVALLLSVSVKSVYRWAGQGALPAVKLSDRVIRFDPAEIEAWLESAKGARG